jgi:MOSC domain-containing protein YiiM
MEAHTEIRTLPGYGLEGDRYALGKGGLSRWGGPHREVTLIAREMLDAMHERDGVVLSPAESRRNLLVEGVDLEALLGGEFAIGGVHFQGEQRCQPCRYLMRVTGRDDLLPAMIGRGGLRARVLNEGVIRVGDAVRLVLPTE